MSQLPSYWLSPHDTLRWLVCYAKLSSFELLSIMYQHCSIRVRISSALSLTPTNLVQIFGLAVLSRALILRDRQDFSPNMFTN